VDLAPVAEVVSERIWKAMVDASAELTRLGIKHALVGGLAVGAHGWPRATKDVDFLVDDGAFAKSPAGIVTMRPGLPIEAHGVAIDSLSIRDDERYLQGAVTNPVTTREGVPVAPIEALVTLKLKSPRAKDATDVIELVKAGIDADLVRAFLATHAAALVPRFDDLVARARAEEE